MPARRNLSLMLCWGTALSLAAGAVRADNWERFRGPNGDGVSNDKNIFKAGMAAEVFVPLRKSGE